jgi:hypothetical protein
MISKLGRFEAILEAGSAEDSKGVVGTIDRSAQSALRGCRIAAGLDELPDPRSGSWAYPLTRGGRALSLTASGGWSTGGS